MENINTKEELIEFEKHNHITPDEFMFIQLNIMTQSIRNENRNQPKRNKWEQLAKRAYDKLTNLKSQ